MQLALRADSISYDGSPSVSHRNKLVVAGIAMASASVLAVHPVTPASAIPDVRAAAVELTAIANPLIAYQETITNTLASLNRLGTGIPAASTALAQALGNPALQAELFTFLGSTATNPLPLLNALINFPSTFGDRINAANAESMAAFQDALAKLPGALLSSAGFLAQGEFTEAFSVLNVFFLTEFGTDGRQALLDVLAIPGDFADSIGAAPLARVFDAVLNRTVVGNLGRALLAPAITAILQTTEILDRTRAALLAGDFMTVASELISLPALVTNAFLNGYVPSFTVDFPSPQLFPGLLSERGTLDFFFVQLPNALATALNPPVSSMAAVSTAEAAAAASAPAPTDVPTGTDTVTISVDPALSAGEGAPESSGTSAGSADTTTPVVASETSGEGGEGGGTSTVDESEEGTADDEDEGTQDGTSDDVTSDDDAPETDDGSDDESARDGTSGSETSGGASGGTSGGTSGGASGGDSGGTSGGDSGGSSGGTD